MHTVQFRGLKFLNVPAAFAPRLSHFLIQAGVLWALGTLLMGVTSNGWPRLRHVLVAVTALGACGLVWAAMPV